MQCVGEELVLDTSEREKHRRWWVVLLLFLGMVVSYIDRGNLSIAAVPIVREFNLSPSVMGTLMSAFFWTYALLQIPAGYVIDRFGVKWTYAIGFMLWSLASAGVGLVRSFSELLALRLALGVGEAIGAPASLTYIKRRFGENEQGLPTAIYIAGVMIGPALGASLGALILDRLGWRPLFILTGLIALVWLLPWLLLAPSRLATTGQRTIREGSASAGVQFPWKQLMANPVSWGLTIGALLYPYCWYFCLTWLPFYLVTIRGLSFLEMGTYIALPYTVMAASALIFGRFTDRLIQRKGRPLLIRKAFTIAGLAVASSVALIALVDSASLVLLTLLLAFAALGLASPNYWALTQVISPGHVIGRVIGYQNAVVQLGGMSAPFITGLLVERSGSFTSSILLAGAAPLLAAATILALIRQKDVDGIHSVFLNARRFVQ